MSTVSSAPSTASGSSRDAAPAIRTRGLTKFYGSARGVEDVDLEVRTGEVFGFLGPNGAGKTTTIRLLLDLMRPTAGSAEVLGLDPWADSVEVRRRTGYMPGELALYRDMSGQDLLDFLGRLRGGFDRGRVDALVERFGVELRRPVRELSTGNKRKVAIVQAFAHEPELLVLDEPTSGLDPLLQAEFARLVRETTAEGRTVFLSSHTLSEVDRVADRVGIMRQGHLVVVEQLATLKQLATRHIEVELADPGAPEAFADVPHVREVDVDGTSARFTVEGSVDALVKRLATHRVVDLHSPETDLEDVFLGFYREEGAP